MGLGSFRVFYSKFIKLVAKLKFIKEILLQKFMHKLSSFMQNRIDSRLEYLDNIKHLAIRCQKIYDQMMAIDWIRLNIKPANTKIANISIRFILFSFQTMLTYTNIFCLRVRNTFSLFINKKQLKLIKKKKCFYC